MENLYDVIIIGGGPAGLTAGLYSARARLKTLLIENPSIASQVVITAFIENYPGFPEGIGGPDLAEKMKKQAQAVGLEIIWGEVKNIQQDKNEKFKIFKITIEEKIYETLSLIIAAGAQPKLLNVPGEDKFKGRGVSYCAICDGAFFRNKDIVVVGGGDTAIDEAIFLTRFAKSIKIIHRRDRLRATKIIQEKAFNEKKIEFALNAVVTEIVGKAVVSGVKVKDNKTNKETIIPCNGVFVFVGYAPNTSFANGLVNLDIDGYIATDDIMKTSCEGIFACGDCRHKTLRQVVTAAGDGAVAAFSAQKYVENLKGTAY